MEKIHFFTIFLLCWINVFINSTLTDSVDCMFQDKKTSSIFLFCYNYNENNFSKCKKKLLINSNNNVSFNVKILRTIYCKGSHLNEALLSQFPTLEKLDVSSYEFVNFTISEENHKNLRTLKILIASNNRLTELRQSYLQPMTALTEVDFSRNNISLIDKFISTELTLINLSQNNISELHNDTFLELRELKILDLSFNRIKLINDKLFINNKNLAILSLSNNHIKYFGCTEIFSSLSLLNIANNKQMNTSELLLHLTNRIQTLNLTGIILDELAIDIITSKFSKQDQIDISYDLLLCESLRMVVKRWQNDQSKHNLVEKCNFGEQLSTLGIETVETEEVKATTEPMTDEQMDESTFISESKHIYKLVYIIFTISFSSVLVMLSVALAIWFFCHKGTKAKFPRKIKQSNDDNIYEIVKIKPVADFI